MEKNIFPSSAPSRDGGSTEAAAYWDARLRSPDCTRVDRDAYEAWRAAGAENARAFENLQDIIGSLRAAGSRPMMRALREAALRKRRRRFLVAGLSVAAAISVVVVGFLLQRVPEEAGGLPQVASVKIVPTTPVALYEATVGERKTFTLEDGSVITLNTRSRLETSFSPGRRDVRLLAGQASFRVAHDATRPFVVAAGNRQVTAIGTEFDVRLEGSDVRVVVVQGRVAVERRPEGRILDAMLRARRELTPGESYSTKDDGVFRPASAVRTIDVNQAVLWEEGRVAFNDVPLTEAVAEMNRYSKGALVIADPSMSKLRVSGVFRTDQSQAFVNAVKEYFPIETRKQTDGDTLLVWRQ